MKRRSLTEYNNSWTVFRIKIEKKVKNRCKLTRKNWKRLREYHFEVFLKTCSNKLYFILRVPGFLYLLNKKREVVNSKRTLPCSHKKVLNVSNRFEKSLQRV